MKKNDGKNFGKKWGLDKFCIFTITRKSQTSVSQSFLNFGGSGMYKSYSSNDDTPGIPMCDLSINFVSFY
jgi:hypothetical protein